MRDKDLITFAPRIEPYIPFLRPSWEKWGIAEWLDKMHWLAQTAHESGRYVYAEEIWGPTTQQKRYERDFDQPFTKDNPRNSLAFSLGNKFAGDGRRFKGHGLIQTTGRNNTLRTSIALFGDDRAVERPSILAQPEYAVESAAYFWNWKNITPLALADDVNAVTKRVNGGYNGLKHRKELLARAKKIL